MTLALLKQQQKAQITTKSSIQSTDKWQIYRWLCEGKSKIGVNDRSLAVLSALLSFYPEAELHADKNLVVFPSNKQLSLRAHGMPDTTLRRHIHALVDKGLILRKDSPNGKRYARKDDKGKLDDAFGFSLAPLLIHAEDFRRAAEDVQKASRELRIARERVSLHRRDIAKLLEIAFEQSLPGEWNTLHMRFRELVDALPRRATTEELAIFEKDFATLQADVEKALISLEKSQNMAGKECQNGRHYKKTESDIHIKNQNITTLDQERVNFHSKISVDLSVVLKKFPQVIDYSTSHITRWSDLNHVCNSIRNYFGIGNELYNKAIKDSSEPEVSIIICYILERIETVSNAGGYFCSIVDKFRKKEMTLVNLLK